MRPLLTLTAILLASCSSTSSEKLSEENKKFLQDVNAKLSQMTSDIMFAQWHALENPSEEATDKVIDLEEKLANYSRGVPDQISKIPWRNIDDQNARRQFEAFSVAGPAILPANKFSRRITVIEEMDDIYRTAIIFENIRNEADRKKYWIEGRSVMTKKLRDLFSEYVELTNESARLNNFTDFAEIWWASYEEKDFRGVIESLWVEIKPLFLQLHAYVRTKLKKEYGDVVSSDGPIPHHLLSDMWTDVLEFTQPYPNAKALNITEEMLKGYWDQKQLFKTAESFFLSLDFPQLPLSFWNMTLQQQTKGTHEVDCIPSSWDFSDGQTYAIRHCLKVKEEDLYIAHLEMGEVQYFMAYKDQPFIFRSPATPGFLSAIGNLVNLNLLSSSYLKDSELVGAEGIDHDNRINILYSMSLNYVVTLPLAYAIDSWRWDVFKGKIGPTNYTCSWWKRYEDLLGVEPAVSRSEHYFDAAAVYHTLRDPEYIRHFVGLIIQFQLYKSFCIKSGEYDPGNPSKKPLHECNLYAHKESGALLRSLMQAGNSRPWQDLMQEATGQRKMDASGLMDYFKPLMDWLTEENKRTKAHIGWNPSTKKCDSSDKP